MWTVWVKTPMDWNSKTLLDLYKVQTLSFTKPNFNPSSLIRLVKLNNLMLVCYKSRNGIFAKLFGDY